VPSNSCHSWRQSIADVAGVIAVAIISPFRSALVKQTLNPSNSGFVKQTLNPEAVILET